MKHPRKRRPIRARQWAGHVTEVYPDIVGSIIVAVGHEFPDLYAEFDRALFDHDVQAGTIFNLYTHRRGRKIRTVLRTVKRNTCTTCGGSGWIRQEGQIGAPGSGCTHGCPDCDTGRARLAAGEILEARDE